MPTLTYALVGAAGGIAKTHLDSLGRMPDVRLTALVDLNETAGRARADAIGAAFFADHRTMLREARPDVVVVVTPHPFHPQVAIDSFEAGAHVLTEKPIAISTSAADAMIDAADRTVGPNGDQRQRHRHRAMD